MSCPVAVSMTACTGRAESSCCGFDRASLRAEGAFGRALDAFGSVLGVFGWALGAFTPAIGAFGWAIGACGRVAEVSRWVVGAFARAVGWCKIFGSWIFGVGIFGAGLGFSAAGSRLVTEDIGPILTILLVSPSSAWAA